MGGDLNMAWEALQPLIVAGFTIGVVLAVLVGAIRVGWALAPWILIGAGLILFFG